MTGQCEIKGCQKPAKYALYKTFNDGKRWLHVCKEHEGKIGNENTERAGGYLTERTLDELRAIKGAIC